MGRFWGIFYLSILRYPLSTILNSPSIHNLSRQKLQTMEKLAIHGVSNTAIPVPTHLHKTPEPGKPLSNTTLTFPKTHRFQSIETHLKHLCEKNLLTEAINTLESLPQQSGSQLNPETFINLLQLCIDSNSITLGRKIHAKINLLQCHKTLALETKLVGMYAKCGALKEARKVFDGMPERDLYAWSSMIGACCREQRWKEVVGLFYLMVKNSVLPDGFLVPKILQACGNCGDFEAGLLVHSLIVKCGLGIDNRRVNNAVLSVYAKCGKLDLAKRVFRSMGERDIVAWNGLISGYCQRGEIEEANRLVDAMREEGTQPNLVTWNILITGYNQMGDCDVAMKLMKRMEDSGISPDVVAWTSMVSGFGQNNRRKEALDLFKDMILSGVEPNGVTIASAVSACASLRVLLKGLEIHSLALKLGFGYDVLVGNALIDMYSKCGELEAARLVFDAMSERDMYTWNTMIGGFCQAGYCGKSYELFMRMKNSDLEPDVITWNTMISGYIQNGHEDQATDLFQRMETDGKVKRDTASWNSLIAGFLQIGKTDKALAIFRQMQASGVCPNQITMLSVLPACSSLIASEKIKEIHCCLLRRELDSAVSIANSLIDTYCKSGNIVYSRTIFDRMTSKDVITMNTMLSGYVLHGRSKAALDIIDQMKKLAHTPTRGTFVNIILAYSLTGLVDEGKQVFSSMKEDYQIVPELEHYIAMIDLYGRSGRLLEAMEFIEDMSMKPDFTVWNSLLDACRFHGDVGLALRAMESLLEFEPGNSSNYQSFVKAYRKFGKPEEALKRLANNSKVVKPTGQSWIESKNTVHSFVSGDRSKSCSDLQFSWIDSLSREVKLCDLDGEFCIEEEDNEEVVGVHSEKLALAFAFVNSTSIPASIRIVKNLRMCGDCHEMAKYISVKYGCEIYLSDTKRLHHFKSGSCSCGDYW